MKSHLEFRQEYLPTDFSKVETLIVPLSLSRKKDISILAAVTKTSDQFWSLTLLCSLLKISKVPPLPQSSLTKKSSTTCSFLVKYKTGLSYMTLEEWVSLISP